MKRAAKEANLARRAQTVPRVGLVTALAVEAIAPALATFKRVRNFAASCNTQAFGMTLGLVSKQHSTGGKARLGKTSKMGQRDIRTLLEHSRKDDLQDYELA